MGGGFFRPITKAISSTIGKPLGLQQDVQMPAQQQTQAETPAPAPAAVTPNDQSANTDTGVSNEKAQRKGKRAVTIQRGTQGTGSGLNV